MGNKLCGIFFRNTNAINTEKLLKNEINYESYVLDIDKGLNTHNNENTKNINSYNECFPYGMEILK